MMSLSQIPPSAKVIGALVTGTVVAFMAGVGTTVGAGEFKGLPEAVSMLQIKESIQDTSIASLRRGLEEASDERGRILCLVELTATGETYSPLQVNQRCP